jgi:hypothetical protein
MAGKAMFPDRLVREIKMNLVLGVPCSVLARKYGCGEETIGRMKRGTTYAHVRVEGEERLRPAIEAVAMTAEGERVMYGVTKEQEDESQRQLLEKLAKEGIAVEGAEEDDPFVMMAREVAAKKAAEEGKVEVVEDKEASEEDLALMRQEFELLGMSSNPKTVRAAKKYGWE